MRDQDESGPLMTAVERAIALRSVKAFRGVPMEQLAHVAAVAREQSYPEGSMLFDEGELPRSLIVILDGKVQLERNGSVFAEAVAGEPLGTWSLFDDRPLKAGARVAEPTRALVLDREDFYDVLAEHVEITKGLVQDLVRTVVALAGPDERGEK